jgi:hypothetical protein
MPVGVVLPREPCADQGDHLPGLQGDSTPVRTDEGPSSDDGRRVDYVPDVDDFDERLLAGDTDIRVLFARRIADPRFISTVVIGK